MLEDLYLAIVIIRARYLFNIWNVVIYEYNEAKQKERTNKYFIVVK